MSRVAAVHQYTRTEDPSRHDHTICTQVLVRNPQPHEKQKGYRGAIDHSCSPGPRVARPRPLLDDPAACLFLCPRGLWYLGVRKFSKTAKSSGWPLTEDYCCACRLVEVDSTPPPKAWKFSPLFVALGNFSVIPSPADPDGPPPP